MEMEEVGAERKMPAPKKALVVFLGCLAGVVWVLGSMFDGHGPGIQRNNANHDNVGTTQPVQSSLLGCKKADAKFVLESVSQMATVEEENGGISYTFRAEWWATIQPRVGELIHGIADADACVHQTARHIFLWTSR
jgi:hypothetical protein